MCTVEDWNRQSCLPASLLSFEPDQKPEGKVAAPRSRDISLMGLGAGLRRRGAAQG